MLNSSQRATLAACLSDDRWPYNWDNNFSGSIGKQLSEFVSERAIAQSKAIPNPTFPSLAPYAVEDQHNAYNICTALIQQ